MATPPNEKKSYAEQNAKSRGKVTKQKWIKEESRKEYSILYKINSWLKGSFNNVHLSNSSMQKWMNL